MKNGIYHDWRGLAEKQADRITELEYKIGLLSRENFNLRQQLDKLKEAK